MDKTETEQAEEMSDWVLIQTSPKSPTIDAITPQNSPILQPANPPDDDEDSVVPVVGEKEDESSSSTVNLSLPWRMIETAKKRLINDSWLFIRTVERIRCNNYGVFWSFTLVGGFFLVSSLVYMKLLRWWRRLQEEKLRFLLCLLREKDQKINELLVEIGRLKELLSSRSRVRVVRIL